MNRSEELARLLELEQMYKIKMYSGIYFIPESKLEEVVKFNTCDLDAHSSDIIKRAVKIYPNFTKPDNFVKLLEVKRICLKEIPNMMMAFLEMDKDVITSTIEASIKELNSEYWKEKGFVDLFKQQAQQTDWTY